MQVLPEAQDPQDPVGGLGTSLGKDGDLVTERRFVQHTEGVLDTNVIAALAAYDPTELPEELLITAVTLGELSHGPHATDDPTKRAKRMAVLQHVEATFDPLPYDRDAARVYGQMCAAVIAIGRRPRGRSADQMVAATAASNGLSLYTSNPKDFQGLESLVEVVAITRPPDA